MEWEVAHSHSFIMLYFRNHQQMKNIILTIFAAFLLHGTITAQFADPALGGADYAPDPFEVGDNSTLTFSWSNSGFSTIPTGSVEIVVSFPNAFYATDGTTPPTGSIASAFTWTHETTGGGDTWRGVLNTPVSGFGGGEVVFIVTGIAITSAPEITTIFTQPISDFSAFNNAPGNDNLTPAAEIIEAANACAVNAGILGY